MRHLCLAAVVFLIIGGDAVASDLWTFEGRCTSGVVKQARPTVDLSKLRGSEITCDAATIIELDNGRKLVQFVQKRGKVGPLGFAGNKLNYTDGNYVLLIDRVHPQHRVHPQQGLAGKSTDQIFQESATPAMPSEGYCFFSNSDFSKLTEFACVSKTENADSKIIYRIAFNVDSVSVKHGLQGSDQNSTSESPTQVPSQASSFDRIFEYTLFNETLADGKHPVWLYFQTGEKIIRVNMPSLDMCVVTPRSEADWGVIRSRNYDVIPEASKEWDFALQIWNAAFQRYMLVGHSKAC
jgi:hypothetical protein